MLLYSRRNLILAAVSGLALSACGFEPVYKEGSATASLKGQIEIVAGKSREEFDFRERLLERFGFSETAKYRLTYTYDVESSGLAVSNTAEITRYNLSGVSKFKIYDVNGTVVYQSAVTASTAYSATSKTYPTRVAEQDARSRLALALADQIVSRIGVTAGSWVK